MTGRTSLSSEPDRSLRSQVSRRGFLIGTGAVALGGAALLSACGGNGGGGTGGGGPNTSVGVAALPGGTPVRGGTFTAGVLTLGAAENLFPGTAVPMPDVA